MESKKIEKKQNVVFRLIRTLFQFYPALMPVTVFCIIFSAVVSSIPAVFMQNVIAIVEKSWRPGDWSAVGGRILSLVGILVTFYVLSLISSLAYNQMMAVITQGSLKKFREKMFDGMQDLPIRYFDTHNHGDIMSHYTNDIDTLRQMISQSFPQLMISTVTVCTIFFIMIYYCLWLALVVLVGVTAMLMVTRKVGGGSARHFLQQQVVLGQEEGYIEEIMNGQKVVKVFCHEEESKADFDRINDALFAESERANKYRKTIDKRPYLSSNKIDIF